MNKPKTKLTIVMFLNQETNRHYTIHCTQNVIVSVSRYIWNITVTYIDMFINNVPRYVTGSNHISI